MCVLLAAVFAGRGSFGGGSTGVMASLYLSLAPRPPTPTSVITSDGEAGPHCRTNCNELYLMATRWHLAHGKGPLEQGPLEQGPTHAPQRCEAARPHRLDRARTATT